MKIRVGYIEISLVSWNVPNGPKHQGSILKNMASSEEGQLIGGAFHIIRDEIVAAMLQTAKKWNWKLIFTHQCNVLERFEQQLQVLHQSTCTFKAGLWSLGKTLKMFQPNFEPRCKNKLKLIKKGLCLNSTEKLAKKRLMYVKNNLKVLKLQRKRCHFRLSVFAFNFEWFYCCHWRVLPEL